MLPSSGHVGWQKTILETFYIYFEAFPSFTYAENTVPEGSCDTAGQKWLRLP